MIVELAILTTFIGITAYFSKIECVSLNISKKNITKKRKKFVEFYLKYFLFCLSVCVIWVQKSNDFFLKASFKINFLNLLFFFELALTKLIISIDKTINCFFKKMFTIFLFINNFFLIDSFRILTNFHSFYFDFFSIWIPQIFNI